MQTTLREQLTQFAHLMQFDLFPVIAEQTGEMTESARRLVVALAMLPLARFIPVGSGWNGRPPKCRLALASAFVAKAVYNLATTRQLLERLQVDSQLRRICGWRNADEVPHESTFSRAFADFATMQFPELVHECLVRQTQRDRLIGHICRDSTAISAREKVATDVERKALKKRPRGRPRKDSLELPAKRLARQRRQSLDDMIRELPTHCSVGTKSVADGHKRWFGYKLHIDVADGQIPISCLLSAASLHDSQVAIPLATMTAERVVSLYDLMDAAYDAGEIRAHSRSLGHVPVIAPNPATVPILPCAQAAAVRYHGGRRKPTRRPRKITALEPHEAKRYAERSSSERVNARLKDEFGGRSIRVRGARKIMAHLMFGILALTVDQLLRMVS